MNSHLKHSRRISWSSEGAGNLTIDSAGPILNAAGTDAKIDNSAMIRGINLCYQWYKNAREFSTNKGLRERTRRLELINKKARALDLLLAKDDSWLPISASPSYNATFRAPIRSLIELIDQGLKKQPDGAVKAYQDSFKIRSPFEWLVGEFLADVFFLLNIASIHTPKELLSQKSPYIRFIEATLAELQIGSDGQPYSQTSIIRAVRAAVANESRRKNGKNSNDFSFWRNTMLRAEMGLPPPSVRPREPQPGFYMVPMPPD